MFVGNLKLKNIMEKEITINVVAPIDCTDEQFKEWCEYSLGYIGGMSTENPLHEYELEATYVDIH